MSTRSKALNKQRNPRPRKKEDRPLKWTPEQHSLRMAERKEARDRVAAAKNKPLPPLTEEQIEATKLALLNPRKRKRTNYWFKRYVPKKNVA